MRTLLAASLALALSAGAARADDPTTTDLRCIIVSGNLAQSTDPDLKKIGTVSLLYFWGRLEGRGATAGVDTRVAEAAKTMTPEDFKTQAQTCGALVSAAGDALTALAGAVQQRMGAAPPAK